MVASCPINNIFQKHLLTQNFTRPTTYSTPPNSQIHTRSVLAETKTDSSSLCNETCSRGFRKGDIGCSCMRQILLLNIMPDYITLLLNQDFYWLLFCNLVVTCVATTTSYMSRLLKETIENSIFEKTIQQFLPKHNRDIKFWNKGDWFSCRLWITSNPRFQS